MLVELNVRDRQAFDVWRLDLRSGGLTLDTQNPGDAAGWVIDETLAPSLLTAFDAPRWPAESLPPAGACYRALRRLPGRDFASQVR